MTVWKWSVNMPDQMHNKLGAYMDGELGKRDQLEVEAHLETCLACRKELEEMRQLSLELSSSPQPDFTPALDFKAQLMLQLPRREETTHPNPEGKLLPWMVPTLVLAVWIFIQVTLGLSTLLLLASQAGFFDGAAAWVASAPQQMLWYSTAQATVGNALGPQELSGLTILNDAGVFMQNLVTLLLWQVGAAALYWGTLTLMWQSRVKAMWNSFTMG
jgi:predicted anti-sigma-YlaC factor YlaD